jgi:hypothetical protein
MGAPTILAVDGDPADLAAIEHELLDGTRGTTASSASRRL